MFIIDCGVMLDCFVCVFYDVLEVGLGMSVEIKYLFLGGRVSL